MNGSVAVAAPSSRRFRAWPEEGGHLWAIVLAGGEGLRLRTLTRHLYGDERPKQFAAVVGARSLLRQTLDRVALLIPPERTIVVTLASHGSYVEAELRGAPRPHVLAQAYDRGTAAGVLLPAHWISARDPEATVVVFPSDHFVLEESAFMCHVADVARTVPRRSESMILLAAEASPSTAGSSLGKRWRGRRAARSTACGDSWRNPRSRRRTRSSTPAACGTCSSSRPACRRSWMPVAPVSPSSTIG